MSAGSYNLEIEQGATLSKPIVVQNEDGSGVDLTGFTARLQARKTEASPDVLFELSTANGGIEITVTGEGDDVESTITLRRTAEVTAALGFGPGKYDLELTAADGTVTRLLEGRVSLSREVTR
jgi:hypothetical protein